MNYEQDMKRVVFLKNEDFDKIEVHHIWSQCRKTSRRKLVGDSPTEQFVRSRGLRQKQALPHLVSRHRKTSWGSLVEKSLTEQIISSNIVSNRRCKNVLPFVRAYDEKYSAGNCFFFVHNTVILKCSVLFLFFNRRLFLTLFFVSAKLRLHFCQLKGKEKLITKESWPSTKVNSFKSVKHLMHLMHPVVFIDMQFENYIRALHGIGKYWKNDWTF